MNRQLWLIFFSLLLIAPFANAQDDPRNDIIKYGTETGIANLIQTLRTEKQILLITSLSLLRKYPKTQKF